MGFLSFACYTEIKTSENHRQNRWFIAGEKGAQNEPPEEPPKPSLSTEEPPELLLSWTPEQLAYMRDTNYWRSIVGQSRGAEVLEVSEMESNDEVWADWLRQENEYAIGDRRSMEAGAGKYLNFIKIVLRKK